MIPTNGTAIAQDRPDNPAAASLPTGSRDDPTTAIKRTGKAGRASVLSPTIIVRMHPLVRRDLQMARK
jgi:hypothetical protein